DKIKKAIEAAVAVLRLDAEDAETRIAAIEAVSGNMSAHVRAKLTRLAGDDSLDAETREAAARALERIEAKAERYELLSTMFFVPEPRIRARARGDRPLGDVRHQGRDQHGARRADHARRLHDVRHAAGLSERDRLFAADRDPRGLRRLRARRHRDRARHREVSLRPAAGDA